METQSDTTNVVSQVSTPDMPKVTLAAVKRENELITSSGIALPPPPLVPINHAGIPSHVPFSSQVCTLLYCYC